MLVFLHQVPQHQLLPAQEFFLQIYQSQFCAFFSKCYCDCMAQSATCARYQNYFFSNFFIMFDFNFYFFIDGMKLRNSRINQKNRAKTNVSY